MHIFNDSFPLIRQSRKRSHDKPWITKGLKISIRHNHRLYRNKIIKINAIHQTIYRNYNAKLKATIRSARDTYYQELFKNKSSAALNLWKNMGNIINNKNKKKRRDISKLMNDGVMNRDK